MKLSLRIAAMVLACSTPAFAQHAHQHIKPIPSGSSAIRFVDALQETTRPGAPGQQPTTTWKFIAIWNSPTPPTTFFWRPDGERWMTCAVSRVHGFISQEKTPVYKKEVVELKQIRRGDMIEIVSQPGGRDIMPAMVKARNAIGLVYFKRSNAGAWETANPGIIHKVMDIVMP